MSAPIYVYKVAHIPPADRLDVGTARLDAATPLYMATMTPTGQKPVAHVCCAGEPLHLVWASVVDADTIQLHTRGSSDVVPHARYYAERPIFMAGETYPGAPTRAHDRS